MVRTRTLLMWLRKTGMVTKPVSSASTTVMCDTRSTTCQAAHVRTRTNPSSL